MNPPITSYKQLETFKNGMKGTMEIFHITKQFPHDEKYSLVDQIRRSSRSVCANMAEAWRKRRYQAAFIAKLNDAEAEASETQVWIEIAHQCSYLPSAKAMELDDLYDHILSQIICMIDQPEKWVIGSRL